MKYFRAKSDPAVPSADPKQKPQPPSEPAEAAPLPASEREETDSDPTPENAQALPDELTDPGASRNGDAHPL
ncbi:hypothetical protein [Hymenobacter cellulosilyticus]|uniref:Uncharacterized protein n=1 Tax=Hymenobacter cellulosilyticus TaxID=2932248 RepID=A0A8T9Q3A0_9BACT|nr:hypothetical protein [Hymenobacter cellulosilyticus]UOQ71515.1 hypothetical protein MUN79_23325 [Hymenobacter cellulosilyticus]